MAVRFRPQRKILLKSKDTNDVGSLLLLQGSQRPLGGLSLSLPNGLLVQFRREVAAGGPRPVGTGDVRVPTVAEVCLCFQGGPGSTRGCR